MAQPLYLKPLGRETQRMSTSSYQGTPRGFSRWARYPFLIQFHHPVSGTLGNLHKYQKVHHTHFTKYQGNKYKKTTKELRQTLETVTILCLLPYNIKNRINKLRSLSIMPLRPVVSSTRLSKYKVIRPENLPIRTSTNTVHSTRLQVHEHCTRNKPPTRSLIVVHIHTLQLQIWWTNVPSSRVYSMLITNNFPELWTNLVTALTTLYVKDLSHFCCFSKKQDPNQSKPQNFTKNKSFYQQLTTTESNLNFKKIEL